MNDDLLTVSEAAALLNVNPETLRRWDNDGRLPAIKINERGDRRWRRTDVQVFLSEQSPNRIIVHKGFEISLDGEGFVTEQGNFGMIGKYEIMHEGVWSGCAFHTDYFMRAKSGIDKAGLRKLAEEKITKLIDQGMLDEGIASTFEFTYNDFVRVWYPSWWKGDTPILLADRLLATVIHVAPIAPRVEAWRCLVDFENLSDNRWVKTKFGRGLSWTELAIEVSAEYLEDKTEFNGDERGAMAFALHYVQDQFNDTKDSMGDRSIERIAEQRVACWRGRCQTNTFIPVNPLNGRIES